MSEYSEHRNIGKHSVSYERKGSIRMLVLDSSYSTDYDVTVERYMIQDEDIDSLRNMLNEIYKN